MDVAAGHAVGVNGIDITECNIAGDRIRLGMTSPFRWARKPVVVFRGAAADRRYRLVVNGAEIGVVAGKDLTAGVPVPAPAVGKNGAVVR